MDIKIDVDGATKVAKALRTGLMEGLDDSGKYLINSGAEVAEDEVVGARKVWTEETKKSFETNVWRFNRTDHWKGSIINQAKQAAIVDEGIAPAGEHKNPDIRIQDIMPWVVAHLSPADYDGGDGDPGLTDYNGGDGPDGATPLPFEDDERNVDFTDLSELAPKERDFSSKYVKGAEIGSGQNAIWKSHDNPGGPAGNSSGIANEIVWSHAQEVAGYDLGPRSKFETAETVDGEEPGTLQEYVDGDKLANTINMNDNDLYFNEDQGRFVNFVSTHPDWFAKTNALDYLAGNSDRHAGNIYVDGDTGNPRAIDSGGMEFNEGLHGGHLRGPIDLTDYDTSNDPEVLFDESQKFLTRTEEVLDELLQDEDFKDSLIAKVKEIHGPDSQEADRIEEIIGDEIGPGHALYEGDTGEPLYKRHIQKGLNVNKEAFGRPVPEEDKTDITYRNAIVNDGDDDGSEPTLDETDEILDSVFGEFQ
jgi:hypothetical protein